MQMSLSASSRARKRPQRGLFFSLPPSWPGRSRCTDRRGEWAGRWVAEVVEGTKPQEVVQHLDLQIVINPRVRPNTETFANASFCLEPVTSARFLYGKLHAQQSLRSQSNNSSTVNGSRLITGAEIKLEESVL